ncbi:MAG: adenine methyltransferase [Rhodopirellula sp.]|nr:adenine methyltransferase [Rhodopirellula sp.]
MAGMGTHQKAGNGEKIWLTPPDLINALGPFDLDPCFSNPRPWATANEHFGPESAGGFGGLFEDWFGLVWCNPPYDQDAGKWLSKCADHGSAIALVFARTETEQFHRQIWERATGLFFFEGRLTFCYPNGSLASANGGAPSVLVCYGEAAFDRVYNAGLRGKMIRLRNA